MTLGHMYKGAWYAHLCPWRTKRLNRPSTMPCTAPSSTQRSP